MQNDSSKYLKNRITGPVGIHSELSPRVMLLFGLPFFGIGMWIILMGIGVLEIDSTKLHAPRWVLTAAGFVFFLGGLLIWGTSWRQVRTLKAIRKQMERYPNEPAMADYVWDRNGYTPPRWKAARKSCMAAVFILTFASIPNWIAYYSGDAPMFLKLITILTNLIVIAALCYAVKTVCHAIKLGKTRLEYPHFPLYLGEKVELSIQLPHRVRAPEHAKLTLRCLNEYFEVSGHGKNRSKRLVHKIRHETVQNLSTEQIMQYPGTLKVCFELPIDALSSALQAKSPHFWELEMKLALPGLDLQQSYLLPVYANEK